MTYTKHMTTTRGRRRPMGSDDPLDDILTWMFDTVDATRADPADNVNVTSGGGTSTSSADFTSIGGVCKAKNFPALNASREMQRQLNRVAQVKGFTKISADGDVGAATLALFRRVQALSPGGIMGDPTSCMGIAPDVDVLGAQVKALADSLGAPATVSGPIAISVPTIVTKSGQSVAAPDAGLLGSLATLSGVEKIALLGVAGGIGYLLLAGKKKRRR